MKGKRGRIAGPWIVLAEKARCAGPSERPFLRAHINLLR
jgi:hypothetical protein